MKRILTSKVGDIIQVSNGDVYRGKENTIFAEIKKINRYTHPDTSLTYVTYETEIDGEEFIFLVKDDNGELKIRQYSLLDDGDFYHFTDNIPSNSADGLPTEFIIDSFKEYKAIESHPKNGFKKNEKIACIIGEYQYNDEHAFIELYLSDAKYAHMDTNYHAVYIGKEISIKSIEILDSEMLKKVLTI